MATAVERTETALEKISENWSDSFPKRLRVSADTLTGHEIQGITDSDSAIKLIAIISNPSVLGHGVAELGTFKIQNLYYESEAPAVEFSAKVADLHKMIVSALKEAEDMVTLNLAATRIWLEIRSLKSFLGKISDGHDEVAMALFTVANKCKMEPVGKDVLVTLRDAISLLLNKVCYREDVLDTFQDVLEAGSFSLGLTAPLDVEG